MLGRDTGSHLLHPEKYIEVSRFVYFADPVSHVSTFSINELFRAAKSLGINQDSEDYLCHYGCLGAMDQGGRRGGNHQKRSF